MGNDGGSIARRDEVVKVKVDVSKSDPSIARKAKWTLCRLSRQPLKQPVVADALGRIYNKEAVINWLVEKKVNPTRNGEENGMGHVKGLKDFTTLQLHPYSAKDDKNDDDDLVAFSCPLTNKPMNGSHRFVYIKTSGAVMSESGLKALLSQSAPSSASTSKKQSTDSDATKKDTEATAECPITSKPFLPGSMASKVGLAAQDVESVGDVILINPSEKEEEVLRAASLLGRKGGDKKKSKKSGKDAIAEERNGSSERNGSRKRPSPPDGSSSEEALRRAKVGPQINDQDNERSPAPSAATAIAALAAHKAKATPRSKVLASIYGPSDKDGPKQKESWMTQGTGLGRY